MSTVIVRISSYPSVSCNINRLVLVSLLMFQDLQGDLTCNQTHILSVIQSLRGDNGFQNALGFELSCSHVVIVLLPIRVFPEW